MKELEQEALEKRRRVAGRTKRRKTLPEEGIDALEAAASSEEARDSASEPAAVEEGRDGPASPPGDNDSAFAGK